MEALPPTKAALKQHILRSVYQGGHCWGKMLQVHLDMPTPGNHYGLPYLKPVCRQESCCAVAARKAAL